MAEDESSEVKLLSGGNPQIPKGDGEEPMQAYLDAMLEWKGQIGRHLDGLVREVVPDARRAVRWNSPFWGVDGNGWFLSIHCFTTYVKVTWLNGGSLEPPPPETSKYDHVRYLHIGEDDDVDEEQVRDWLRQAAAIPGDETF